MRLSRSVALGRAGVLERGLAGGRDELPVIRIRVKRHLEDAVAAVVSDRQPHRLGFRLHHARGRRITPGRQIGERALDAEPILPFLAGVIPASLMNC